jgi:branched-chain amino acid transport system substrate-binding protein
MLPAYHEKNEPDAYAIGLVLVLERRGDKGNADGDALVAAMKGMSWESPRGPISIDPEMRDIVQNEYIRRVERVNDQLYNVEFATIEAVKDPMKLAKK